LKISKTHQAADKAKKVGCFCEWYSLMY
jgi:hypothetical protein